MKVVLFCGGQGMRLREFSESIPKPMVPLRSRPILWHVMKYYAHYGHREFILCLGYKGDYIRDYFINYSELLTSDFTMHEGGKRIELLTEDISDWHITFVDTGLHSNIGERLVAVRRFLKDDEVFLANYSDGLTDCPISALVDYHAQTQAIASFVSVRPNHSFHVTSFDRLGHVTAIRDVKDAGMWINGGYFVLRQDIFDYIEEGEELVLQPFTRLIRENRLSALRHSGFWRGIDTFKDLREMEEIVSRGDGPWEVWRGRPQVLSGPRATIISGHRRSASAGTRPRLTQPVAPGAQDLELPRPAPGRGSD